MSLARGEKFSHTINWLVSIKVNPFCNIVTMNAKFRDPENASHDDQDCNVSNALLLLVANFIPCGENAPQIGRGFANQKKRECNFNHYDKWAEV